MKIAIAGAGIAGLTTAVALKKKNIDTVLFEASPEIKAVGAGLALAANAMKAFDVIGLKDELVQRGHRLKALTICDHHGSVITKTEPGNSEENFTIHRADLHSFLMEQLPADTIFTGKKLNYVEQNPEKAELFFDDGSAYQADYVIAADGIHSVVRQQLLPGSSPRYVGYTCWRAVINETELKLPNAREIWGPGGRFGIVPLKDNRTYWFACINSPQDNPEVKNYTVQDLLKQFEGYPEDVQTILKNTRDEDLLRNDILDLKPINRFAFGRTVLIGDAAHATTPNMGQGACMAVEDAVWLAEAMSRNRDFQQVFREFEKSRMKRVHWITKTSWKIGKAAQVSNPLLSTLRNSLFRAIPQSISDRQLKRLYDVRFR